MTEHEKAGCAISVVLFALAFAVLNLVAIVFSFWIGVFK